MKLLARWFHRLGPVGRDRVLAGTLAAVSLIELFVTGATEGPLAVNAVVLALLTAPLAWRRQYPLGVAASGFVIVGVQTAFLTPIDNLVSPFVPLLVAAYSVAAFLEQPRAGAGLLLCVSGVVTVNIVAETATAGDYFFPGMFVVIAWLCGRAVRTHTRLTEELHEAAVRAREAGEEHARTAAADERRRIAREMHDVVAHSVSVMVVQAGGARRILERDPARAVEAARRIEETGRAALAEMRTLLGILHVADDPAVRAPQPTLQHLDALVAHAREAGLPVELLEEGEPRVLPAGVDLAAYRIVQEGLTNALKHAGSPTEVTVRWGENDLELRIADRGPGPARVASANGGHGLVGMAERVRIYGGELETGRRRGGGFEVTARLPL
jgi:signal transduction histidine kinase